MKTIKIAVLSGLLTASASAAVAADLSSRSVFSPAPVLKASRNTIDPWDDRSVQFG